jgi:hypothetical protein
MICAGRINSIVDTFGVSLKYMRCTVASQASKIVAPERLKRQMQTG